MADNNGSQTNWDEQIKELDGLLAQLPPTTTPTGKARKVAKSAGESKIPAQIRFEKLLAAQKAAQEAPPPPPVTGLFGSGTKLVDFLGAQERLFKHVPQPSVVEFGLFRDQTGWITAQIQLDVPSSKAVDGITRITSWEATPDQAIDSLITQFDKAVEEWAQHQEFLAKQKAEQQALMPAIQQEFNDATKAQDFDRLEKLMRSHEWVWNKTTTNRHLRRCAEQWGKK